MFRTTLRFVLPAITAAVLVAGCSGDTGNQAHGNMPGMPTSPASAPADTARDTHNAADVTFAQQMIPHHQQAVTMADLVAERTSNQQVIDLAQQIQQAQDPEIQQLSEWLQQWGEEMPEGHSAHGDMPGMMGSGHLDELAGLRDREFDRRWLELMVEHHQGAIDMARTELAQGQGAEAKRLAQTIIDAQQAEIDTMNGMLGNR
ncbi:DUF305 domain-containing protein [Saccharomonospora sp. NPDC046836]|uniref:DUF305 domain-containing protein n=1 Tax=Saccharomonospora sp. NPDC046836 TaxID=3156921 RepID=UPI0033F5198D